MPSAADLEEYLVKGEMEKHLDAYEISRLHQMMKAAELMDEMDGGDADGNEEPAAEMG